MVNDGNPPVLSWKIAIFYGWNRWETDAYKLRILHCQVNLPKGNHQQSSGMVYDKYHWTIMFRNRGSKTYNHG